MFFQTDAFTDAHFEEFDNKIIDQQNGSEDWTKYATCLLRLEGHDLMEFGLEKKCNDKIKVN